MKNTLYFKFIMTYILLGVVGILTISTLGSSMIQKKILEETGESLYLSLIYI